MGEAKRRGTYEQRRVASVERQREKDAVRRDSEARDRALRQRVNSGSRKSVATTLAMLGYLAGYQLPPSNARLNPPPFPPNRKHK